LGEVLLCPIAAVQRAYPMRGHTTRLFYGCLMFTGL
jgi:hypothetical protein